MNRTMDIAKAFYMLEKTRFGSVKIHSLQGNILSTTRGRFLTFFLLYVSEGLAYGFTSVAMVAYMRTAGLGLDQIGIFVAALFLPWGFKWAWAPVIDVVRLRGFGGRRAWLLICTGMMILTLTTTAVMDFTTNFQLLLLMIVANNVFCATQDVAIDSLAVSTLKEDERGRGNGFMFGGQFTGIAIGGGGAIYVYGAFNFNAALLFVSGLLMLSFLFVFLFVRDPDAEEASKEQAEGSVAGEIVGQLKAFLAEVFSSFFKSGNGPRIAVLFGVLPPGAQALAYATQNTLKVDYGLTEVQLADLSVLITIMSALGCLLGGAIGDRYGVRRCLAAFMVLSAVPTVYLAMRIAEAGLAGIGLVEFYTVLSAHGFLFGMGFGLRAAIFMGLTNPAVAATQFTAFMALTNIAVSIGNFWNGVVAESYGYSLVLYLDAAIVLLPLCLIPFLRARATASSDADAATGADAVQTKPA